MDEFPRLQDREMLQRNYYDRIKDKVKYDD